MLTEYNGLKVIQPALLTRLVLGGQILLCDLLDYIACRRRQATADEKLAALTSTEQY